LSNDLDSLIAAASEYADVLAEDFVSLNAGDFDVLRERLLTRSVPDKQLKAAVRRLRSATHSSALVATNVLADVHAAYSASSTALRSLSSRLVAIVADAGCGKTQLSAQISAAPANSPPGVILFGADLHAGHSLDDLARKVIIQGRPIPSFEALVAAIDAAGERAGRRIPLIIDGLNEAEDPRDWKPQLASLDVTLRDYRHVCVVCTLRSAFVSESLPDAITRLEIPHFDHDTDSAVRKYFHYYKIDSTDADLPWGLLQHPLTLRMFCEVTNHERRRTVGIEQMPDSLTALFDKYLDQAAARISELSPRNHRYYPADVRSALNAVGVALWKKKERSIPMEELRRELSDMSRPWNESIVRLLEDDGVLIRDADDHSSAGREAIVFDMMAGHVIADALLGTFGGTGFAPWLNDPATLAILRGKHGERHPLANDIFRAFVGLVPHRMNRRQLWQLTTGDVQSDALRKAAWLEARYLDAETVSALASLTAEAPGHKRDLLNRTLEHSVGEWSSTEFRLS
jgi:hypothetical protein